MVDFRNILENKQDYYKIYNIRKSNGKVRKISAPQDELKGIQASFYRCIEGKLDKNLPANVTGFRKGLSIKDNAINHLDSKVIVNIDIKDFFPSIPKLWISSLISDLFKTKKVKRYKKKYNLIGLRSQDMVELLTLNNELPQGSPCSPVIANFYLTSTGLDQELSGIENWTYSRYADDLTFSSKAWINKKDIENTIIPFIYEKIRSKGLEPNIKKTRIIYNDQKQLVTGILVNGENPKVPKSLSNRIRAVLHKKILDDKIKGYLAFIKGINKTQHDKLIIKSGDK